MPTSVHSQKEGQSANDWHTLEQYPNWDPFLVRQALDAQSAFVSHWSPTLPPVAPDEELVLPDEELVPPELVPPELVPPELVPPELVVPELDAPLEPLEPPELVVPELEPPEDDPPPSPLLEQATARLEAATRSTEVMRRTFMGARPRVEDAAQASAAPPRHRSSPMSHASTSISRAGSATSRNHE